MPYRPLILLSCLLALASPVQAGERQDSAANATARPLNLSLPRDMLYAPGKDEAEETAQRNLPPPQIGRTPGGAASHPSSLPYGAGYEHRHAPASDAPASAGVNTGGSTRSNGSMGAGRRGR